MGLGLGLVTLSWQCLEGQHWTRNICDEETPGLWQVHMGQHPMSSCFLVASLNYLNLPALEASAGSHTGARAPLRAPAFHYKGGFKLVQPSPFISLQWQEGVGLINSWLSNPALNGSPQVTGQGTTFSTGSSTSLCPSLPWPCDDYICVPSSPVPFRSFQELFSTLWILMR